MEQRLPEAKAIMKVEYLAYFRADIDYHIAEALTTYGIIGKGLDFP